MTTTLDSARFGGDREILQRILADEILRRELQRSETLRRHSVLRARLLSQAVRLDVAVLSHVAESFHRLSGHVGGRKPLEAYVFAEPGVNAFVSEGTRHLLVGVSSGAIECLSSKELDFVIGHELGHALYGHLDVPARLVLETGSLDLDRCRMVLAWQRAAEVSADRAGLVCCGSLEVAATALFKTISGLRLPGLAVNPTELARQWEHLVEEMLDDGRRDQWQLSHPHPPLRMQALLTFARLGAGAAGDAEVKSLLALMAPPSESGGAGEDPYLARFLFWGGAYVALADGAPTEAQRHRLRRVAPAGTAIEAIAEDVALARFQETQRTRRAKLSATELHGIAAGLVEIATSGAGLTQRGLERLHRLGRELNLTTHAMDLMVSKQVRKD